MIVLLLDITRLICLQLTLLGRAVYWYFGLRNIELSNQVYIKINAEAYMLWTLRHMLCSDCDSC